MSFALTTGGQGTVATAQVVWSVTGLTYNFRSDNNFLSWITTIFDVGDTIAGTSFPDYRLLRVSPATQNGAFGVGNLGVGSLANNAVTTGTNNTALGVTTLLANTAGSNNVAVGTNALRLSQASDNVAIGKETLFLSTTSARNVVIGSGAGFAITTAPTANAGGNVLLGYQTGNVITTGVNNIAIGRSANQVTTTGDNNICIGRESRTSGTTRTNCIAIGRDAVAGTSGDGEIAIGSAGYPVLLDGGSSGSSGDYLVVRINSVEYKIDLHAP